MRVPSPINQIWISTFASKMLSQDGQMKMLGYRHRNFSIWSIFAWDTAVLVKKKLICPFSVIYRVIERIRIQRCGHCGLILALLRFQNISYQISPPASLKAEKLIWFAIFYEIHLDPVKNVHWKTASSIFSIEGCFNNIGWPDFVASLPCK